MRIGIDFGFGYTKAYYDGEEGKNFFKFPSWIAHFKRTPLTDIDPIVTDREYAVGEYARFESSRIEVATVEELVRYAPVFVLGVIQHIYKKDFQNALKSKFDIVLGIPPRFKDYKRPIEDAVKKYLSSNSTVSVLPQGFGAYFDLVTHFPEQVLNSDIIIIDIGFNTVDYVILSKEGEKIKGDTIEGMGLTKAVEIFRSSLPTTYAELINFSHSKLITVFERGTVNLKGKELHFKQIRDQAILSYADILMSRLKSEIGNFLNEIEVVAVVGGGAYYVDLGRDVLKPHLPEYSNARGFYYSLLTNNG